MESLDDSRQESSRTKPAGTSSGSIITSTNRNIAINESTSTSATGVQKSPSELDKLPKGPPKPSILQRKRKKKLSSDSDDQHPNLIEVVL